MKRRIRRIANFFAFNLLFFALYLNFIHKDNAAVIAPEPGVQATTAMSGTVPVANPEKYLDPSVETQPAEKSTAGIPTN